MSKIIKILCLIFLCVISVVSFAACGTEKNDNTAVSTTTGEQTEINPATRENTYESSTATDISTQVNVTESVDGTTLAQTEATSTQALTENTTAAEKKGTLYRANCNSKIWAGILGECYMEFKNIDTPNEWGEKGKVYELHVTYVKTGEDYSMWSDGHWSLDESGNKLTLTPVNQSENGNVGVAAGRSKTFTGKNGVFEIPITFEQGGATTVTLKIK